LLVIPAALNSGAGQAGIQLFVRSWESRELDPGFRRDDGPFYSQQRARVVATA